MAQVLQPWQLFVGILAGWINEHQQAAIEYLREENRVLKEQLGNGRLRLTDDQRRRLAAKGKKLGRQLLSEIASIVTPDTILRRHRQLIAQKWTHARRSQGRPRTAREIADLAVRMARENSSWGYGRFQGALENLGYRVGRTTIASILKRHGIEPAPERGKRITWSQFLKAHWSVLAAADFFTVEVWGPRGLVTFYVLFVMELATRRVEIVRLPARSPNLNAYAERFVRSIKSECLSRMIFFGERSLRKATREYTAHCHRERNHQGIDNRSIDPDNHPRSVTGVIDCASRLGGMLRFYRRVAA